MPELPTGFQPVGARPVVPLPVALQLELETEIFKIECVGTLRLLHCERGFCLGQSFVLGGTLLGAITLGPCRAQQLFQRGKVFRQVHQG